MFWSKTFLQFFNSCLCSIPVIHVAGYLLLYASACVNPIIYVIMNAQYRAAYAAALCCPLSRLSGLTSGAYPSSPVACQTKKTERTSAQASYIRPWRYRHLKLYTSISHRDSGVGATFVLGVFNPWVCLLRCFYVRLLYPTHSACNFLHPSINVYFLCLYHPSSDSTFLIHWSWSLSSCTYFSQLCTLIIFS